MKKSNAENKAAWRANAKLLDGTSDDVLRLVVTSLEGLDTKSRPRIRQYFKRNYHPDSEVVFKAIEVHKLQSHKFCLEVISRNSR